MNIKLKLPVFWKDETDFLLEELNIEKKIPKDTEDEFEGSETRELTFYHIDLHYDYKAQGKYTTILSSGETFLIAMPQSKVEKLIQESIC